MTQLFEKTWIGSLELQNRTVRSATWSGGGDKRGYVTERAVEFYRELARGGIGLIVTGYQYIMPNGMQLSRVPEPKLFEMIHLFRGKPYKERVVGFCTRRILFRCRVI